MKIVILITCGFFALGSTEMCSENATMYDLPKGLVAGLISIATTGTLVSFDGCSKKLLVEPDKVRMWLWDKTNLDKPILLDQENPSQLNSNAKTIFLIHGWTCNITGDGYPKMRDAYLKKYPDANVISLEWATYSVDLYVNSYCYVPQVAELLGKFICNLSSKLNVDVGKVHLVGHSFGGQIAGIAGQTTKHQCKKTIGRITGLDPAGPLYQLQPPTQRLDASDAAVVDVIHTNQGQFGYYGSCGTADYYPNCGYYQPGCLHLKSTLNISVIMNLPYSIWACSHQRSIDYFTESIQSDFFKAKSCTICPGLIPIGPCVADIFRQKSSVMGEGHDKYPSPASKYLLYTNSKSPYAEN